MANIDFTAVALVRDIGEFTTAMVRKGAKDSFTCMVASLNLICWTPLGSEEFFLQSKGRWRNFYGVVGLLVVEKNGRKAPVFTAARMYKSEFGDAVLLQITDQGKNIVVDRSFCELYHVLALSFISAKDWEKYQVFSEAFYTTLLIHAKENTEEFFKTTLQVSHKFTGLELPIPIWKKTHNQPAVKETFKMDKNAHSILIDGAFTVLVVLNNKFLTYITTDTSIKVGDMVVVDCNGVITCGEVSQVDQDLRIEPDSPVEFKWVIQRVNMDAYNQFNERLNLIKGKLREAYQQTQRATMRERLLATLPEAARVGLIQDISSVVSGEKS